jgi:DNA-binding MarR family transcriptional regulator
MKADDLGGIDRQLRRGVIPEGWLPGLEGADPSTILIILWAGRLSRRVEVFYQDALRSYGLKYSDYAVLCLLHFLGAMSPKRLNLHLAITSGGLTKSIQRLEKQQLVGREPIPEDGRGTLVSLTKKGERTVTRILAEDVRSLDDLLGDRTSADRKRIASALRDLLDAYERDL